MFRFNMKKEEMKQKERELLREVKLYEKPKFKDLLSIVLAQYLIILPLAIIAIVVFLSMARALLYLWGI
ncbi:MAG: hypothetical protein Q4B63_03730 [Clostridium perfringens]|nr:hypothetical protein [Clostridium perfringens]